VGLYITSTVTLLLVTSSNHPKTDTPIISILLELEVGGVLSVGWEWVKTSDLVGTTTDFLHQLTTDGEFPSIWGVGVPFKSKDKKTITVVMEGKI